MHVQVLEAVPPADNERRRHTLADHRRRKPLRHDAARQDVHTMALHGGLVVAGLRPRLRAASPWREDAYPPIQPCAPHGALGRPGGGEDAA